MAAGKMTPWRRAREEAMRRRSQSSGEVLRSLKEEGKGRERQRRDTRQREGGIGSHRH